MAGGSQTKVGPRGLSFRDSELRCNVRRIYGYGAYCACGWVGHTYRTVQEARLEQSFHRCEDSPPTGGTEAS
jgi:hypothetical protein